jgi:hypothetical protein
MYYVMSEKEETVVEPPPAPKPKRKKREMTEAELERLRANLKKGRETALKNRQKRALANRLDKQERDKQRDEKIAKHLMGESTENEKISELKEEIKTLKSEGGNADEIKDLKSQIKILTDVLQGVIDKTNSKPEPKKDEPKKEPEPVKKEEPENYKLEVTPTPTPQPKPIVNPQPERKVFEASKRKKNKDAFF